MHRRLFHDLPFFALGLGLGTLLMACNTAKAESRAGEGKRQQVVDTTQEVPMASISFEPIQVIGYPLELQVPVPPLATLASEPLVPGYIYQLAWSGGEAAEWRIQLEGGVGSDMILESFPPQLGQPAAEFTIHSPTFAFRINQGLKHPVKLNMEATLADGRPYLKQFFGRSTEFDPGSIDAVPDEILIGLQPGSLATDPAIASWLSTAGLTQVGTLNGDTVIHAKDATGTREFFALHAAVIGDPRVQYAEPNYILHTMGAATGTMGSLGEPVDSGP